MLFCWVAASVAIKVSVLAIGLGPFWILLHVMESHQRPKMSKLYSFFPYLSGKVQITELSYFPALLAGPLSNLAGKQQVSTSQGSGKAEGVCSVQQSDISILTWVFFSLLYQYSYIFFSLKGWYLH